MLPMMVFFLAMLVVGGLTSLMIIINPDDAHRVAFPFTAFFAGLAACALVIIGVIVGEYISDPIGGAIILLMAPTIGLFGGGVFGYRLGRRYRRRATDDDA